MTRRRWIVVLLVGLGFGILMALFTTDDARVVSLQVVLGAMLVVLAIVVATSLTQRRRVGSLALRPIISRGARPEIQLTPRPADLLVLDREVALAVEDPRAFGTTLRPRLVELAEHRLGFGDRAIVGGETSRNVEHFGPVAWLLDPTVVDRTPTADELLTFAARLNGERDDI